MHEVQQTFRDALDSITAKLKQDDRVIGAFVGGSLSYDVVWEKSDIDLMIVTDEEKQLVAPFCLVEHDICISATVFSRQRFKHDFERALQTSFFHSFLSKSSILFCRDAAIQELHDRIRHVGERDLDVQLLLAASHAVTLLEKAEKWIVVKHDPIYCFLWVLKAVEQLARIEVMLHKDIPTREALQQALAYDPIFFHRMYGGLIEGPKTIEAMSDAVRAADEYLERRHERLFKLVLDYLSDEGDVRGFSEMMLHLKQQHRMEDMLLVHGCEWLAQKGYIERASSPVRLTPRSRHEVDELAYFDAKGMFG